MRFTIAVVLLVLACFASIVPEVFAQGVRSPQQNAEYHRAETAWLSGGSLLEAKERLDNVLSALPSDPEALRLRTKILLALDRNDEAYRDAKRAADLMPDDGEANLLLTRAARLVGDTASAVGALARASATIAPDAESHLRLSMESLQLKRYEEAEALARVAVALDPDNGGARLQLARALAAQGNVEASATALTTALQEGLITHDQVAADAVLGSTGVARRVLPRPD